MPASDFLGHILEAYSEAWQAPHAHAMECRDLEEQLEVGLFLYARIEDGIRLRAERGDIEMPDLKAFENLYNQWVKPWQQILADIDELESKGYIVAGAADYRQAVLRVRAALSIPAEHVIETMARIEREGHSKAVPMAEVRRALQDRMGT